MKFGLAADANIAGAARFFELGFLGEYTLVTHRLPSTVTTMSSAMIPLLSHELLAAAVQMVCYFCTAALLTLSLLAAPRG